MTADVDTLSSVSQTGIPAAGQPVCNAASLQQLQGRRLRVIQQISRRDQPWLQVVEGKLLRFERQKTGSWYAHAADGRLWLDRLILQKDDGEITVLSLDCYSRIELLPE